MKSNPKKIVFTAVSLPVFLLGLLIVLDSSSYCSRGTFCGSLTKMLDPVGYCLFIFAGIFPFILITFWMKEEVFMAWFNFARWFVPVMFTSALYLYLQTSSSGFFNMDREFNTVVLGILYFIFAVVSTVKIIMAYRKERRVEK